MMKHKGFYVLAMAAMLALVAGCGKGETENPQNQETEITNQEATVTPEPTATLEPTAIPEPTATPKPKTYMEEKGFKVLGAGFHEYLGYYFEERDENDKPIMKMDTCECGFEVSEEDNGDGTKTIQATLYVVPYVSNQGWSYSVMTGFVDLQSGKSFLPEIPGEACGTELKQGENTIELTVAVHNKVTASSTDPYQQTQITVICPSDYEDAGFYLCGFDGDEASYGDRFGKWKLLQFINHGDSELVVFSVKEGLATMSEDILQERAKKAEVQTTENYFEVNGLETRGKGKTTFLGTEASYDNKENVLEEDVVIETKEVEIEFQTTEEFIGDGKKRVYGRFYYPAYIETEGNVTGIVSVSGFVDTRTGFTYFPSVQSLAEPVVLCRDEEEISAWIGYETMVLGDNRMILTYVVTCPEDYEEIAFFITGNYMNEELQQKRVGNWMHISDIEHGESDMVFFQ